MPARSKRPTGIELKRDFAGKGLMSVRLPAWHDRDSANPPGRKVLLPDISPLGVVALALLDQNLAAIGH
jgi:hypothetical protein